MTCACCSGEIVYLASAAIVPLLALNLLALHGACGQIGLLYSAVCGLADRKGTAVVMLSVLVTFCPVCAWQFVSATQLF